MMRTPLPVRTAQALTPPVVRHASLDAGPVPRPPWWRLTWPRVLPSLLIVGGAPWWIPAVGERLSQESESPTGYNVVVADKAARDTKAWTDSLGRVTVFPLGGVQFSTFQSMSTIGEYLPVPDAVHVSLRALSSPADTREVLAHEFGHVFQSRLGPELDTWWRAHRVRRARHGYAATSIVEQQAEAISQAVLLLWWAEGLAPTDLRLARDTAGVFRGWDHLGPPPDIGHAWSPAPSWRAWIAQRERNTQSPLLSLRGQAEMEATLMRDWPAKARQRVRLQQANVDRVREAVRTADNLVPGTAGLLRVWLTHPQFATHWLVSDSLLERPLRRSIIGGRVPQAPWSWPLASARPEAARSTDGSQWLARTAGLWLSRADVPQLGAVLRSVWPTTGP